MSLLLSLVLTGGLSALPGTRADAAPIQSPAPATKKKNRRMSQKTTPKAPPVETPPLDDLPLGAQDLLMTSTVPAQTPRTGKSDRPASRRPMDNYDFDTPPPRGEDREDTDEPAPEDPEVVWRRAVEEARRELREAEEDKQRQDNADSPPSPEQDVGPRLLRARQTLRRLLEEGQSKQYREQPTEQRP